MNLYSVYFFDWTLRSRAKHPTEGPYYGDFYEAEDAQQIADSLIEQGIPAWVETDYVQP